MHSQAVQLLPDHPALPQLLDNPGDEDTHFRTCSLKVTSLPHSLHFPPFHPHFLPPFPPLLPSSLPVVQCHLAFPQCHRHHGHLILQQNLVLPFGPHPPSCLGVLRPLGVQECHLVPMGGREKEEKKKNVMLNNGGSDTCSGARIHARGLGYMQFVRCLCWIVKPTHRHTNKTHTFTFGPGSPAGPTSPWGPGGPYFKQKEIL